MYRATIGFALYFALSAVADDFTLIAWNVESDLPNGSGSDPQEGNEPRTIAQELAQFVENQDAQIVGLVEVKPSTFIRFRNAIQDGTDSNVDFVSSGSGGDDSMMIVADAERFDTVEAFELHRYEDHIGNVNNL